VGQAGVSLHQPRRRDNSLAANFVLGLCEKLDPDLLLGTPHDAAAPVRTSDQLNALNDENGLKKPAS